ncbi:MAG: bifunctional riboflavin kinase/FAD synthetase [Hyphomicrobiales bacterium]
MKIYQDITEFEPVENAVATIGTFDGVHIGHRYILEKIVEKAKKINGESIVITFYPHPRSVVHADSKDLKFITSQERKKEIIESIGIDHLIIVPFTKEFSKISSEKFIRDFLIKYIRPKKLVIGYDHHFGKNRLGDFKMLYDLGSKYHFQVEKIPPQDVDNIAISSTKIRKALTSGKIDKANKWLGHKYCIKAKVIHGDELGRKIGFPTANLNVKEHYRLLGFEGVYACHVEWKGKMYKGMCNIGVRPTLNKSELKYEVYILDFNSDIYGQIITVYFEKRIRDEIKFNSLEELKAQLERDKETVRELLK